MSRERERRERTATVISLWPNPAFDQNLPTGHFTIEGCPPCKKHSKAPCRNCRDYAKRVVTNRQEAVDIGDDKRRFERVDCDDLAQDLASAVSAYGVLACDGDEPTEVELDEAFENLEAYLHLVLENEDRVWAANKKHFNVQHAMIAASYFGFDRDWLSDTRPKKPCEACGVHNAPNAIKCSSPTCGAILDWEGARNMGLLTERQEEFGLAKGKLKPVMPSGKRLERVEL